MKRILYVGNNLKSKNTNVSSIQVLGNLLGQAGYKMYYTSSKVNKVVRLLDMIWCFFKHLRKVDYILIDTYSTHNFYFALIISQLCRIFRVNYIPNLNGGNLPARLASNKKLSALVFNNAFINISPSYYLKDAFYNFGYKNVKYIPNTIEIKNYKFQEKTFDSIRLLWVRSFSQIYNPQMALKVQKKLIDLGFDVKLCMVGPDSDGTLNDVKALALELGVDVTFTGKLSKKDWITLADEYNIFINTTNFDNTPVSVIEAMALGLPVVSTNVGGIPYLIQDHYDGVLVEKDNVDGMVQAILNISIDKNSAKQLALNARKKVEQFDWQVVKIAWSEILN